MSRTLLSSVAVSALLSLGLLACSSEIDDKAAASVKEAKEAPAAAAPATDGSWALSSDTHIAWVGAKVTKDHPGGFKTVSGKATVKDNQLVSGEVVIDTASLFTDHPKLENHLKDADFFHVAKFPQAVFTITKVAPADGGQHTVTGNLDLHGVKKEISFPAKVTVTGNQATVAAEFTLNRQDFGMAYPGKPDDLIRDEVLVKGKLVFQG